MADRFSKAELDEVYDAFRSSFDAEVVLESVDADSDFSEDEPTFEERLRGAWRGFERVGQGTVTNDASTGKKMCGGYYGLYACSHPELHNHTTLDGVNHAGKTTWRKQFRYCHSFSCPVCYAYGAANQAAKRIARRIRALERRLGLKAEHIIWSPPQSVYFMTYEQLVARMVSDFRALHILGGVRIFHMERFAKHWEAVRKHVPEGWRISIHWHIIGFIDGSYDRCRSCRKCKTECLKCDGFDGRARRLNLGFSDSRGVVHEGNGDIIKVGEERKSIEATAWYQLEHSTMRIDVKRQNIAIWFGVGGKRVKELKNEERFVHKCHLCGYDLVKARWVGEGCVDGGYWFLKSGEADFLDTRGVPNFMFEDGG